MGVLEEQWCVVQRTEEAHQICAQMILRNPVASWLVLEAEEAQVQEQLAPVSQVLGAQTCQHQVMAAEH